MQSNSGHENAQIWEYWLMILVYTRCFSQTINIMKTEFLGVGANTDDLGIYDCNMQVVKKLSTLDPYSVTAKLT